MTLVPSGRARCARIPGTIGNLAATFERAATAVGGCRRGARLGVWRCLRGCRRDRVRAGHDPSRVERAAAAATHVRARTGPHAGGGTATLDLARSGVAAATES